MKKKVIAIMMSAVIACGLVACGSSSSSTATATTTNDSAVTAESTAVATTEATAEASSATDTSTSGLKEITIGYAAPTMNNAFWTAVEDGVKKSIAEHTDIKVNLVEVDGNNDQATMNDKIADLISSGIDALLLAPSDSTAVTSALEQLQQANIPVINFDTPVDPQYVETIIASNNVNAGYVVGQDMATKMPDDAKILVVHSPRASACIDRYDGFVKALDESGKKYTIVNTLDGQGDQNTSLNLVTDALVADPDLNCIFAVNDPSAMGCVNAIEQSTTTLENDILVYGVDGNPDAKKMIEEGRMEGTGSQSPETIGYDSMEAAIKVLNGETVEKNVSVDTFLITKDNVADYGTDGWQ